jgi:pimeloyl-ACP methyl ester carboxylesterase
LATYDETDRLGEISVPVVVVSGELDPASPVEAGALVANRVQNGHQVVVPQASHLAVVEDPRAVAAPLLTF